MAIAQTPPDVLLKQAEKLYEQLEYEKALHTLTKVHSSPEVTPIQRARAYLFMAVCFTALGRTTDAIAAFTEVLKRKPKFRLPPGVSPSIRATFNDALKAMKLPEKAPTPGPAKAQPVSIDSKSAFRVLLGTPLKISISLSDPSRRVTDLVVQWRRRGGPDYSKLKLDFKPGAEAAEAILPTAMIGDKAGLLVYYVEAHDSAGRTIARSGTEEDPFEVTLYQAKKKGSNKVGWWLLGAGGVLAVAGGVVAAILLSSGESNTTPPGSAELTVRLR